MKLLKELLTEGKRQGGGNKRKSAFGNVGTKASKAEATGGAANLVAKHAQSKSGAGAHQDSKRDKDKNRAQQKKSWKKDQGVD